MLKARTLSGMKLKKHAFWLECWAQTNEKESFTDHRPGDRPGSCSYLLRVLAREKRRGPTARGGEDWPRQRICFVRLRLANATNSPPMTCAHASMNGDSDESRLAPRCAGQLRDGVAKTQGHHMRHYEGQRRPDGAAGQRTR